MAGIIARHEDEEIAHAEMGEVALGAHLRVVRGDAERDAPRGSRPQRLDRAGDRGDRLGARHVEELVDAPAQRVVVRHAKRARPIRREFMHRARDEGRIG
jgi:hypothetical protein